MIWCYCADVCTCEMLRGCCGRTAARRTEAHWMEELHVGAERVSTVSICTVLLTNILQRHWEWQEDRRDARLRGFFMYQTAFVAGSDVRMALHVAKCSVMCKILTCMVTNGHVVAALWEEMKDVRSSACFENSETEFRYSRCIRQRSVEAPVL